MPIPVAQGVANIDYVGFAAAHGVYFISVDVVAQQEVDSIALWSSVDIAGQFQLLKE